MSENEDRQSNDMLAHQLRKMAAGLMPPDLAEIGDAAEALDETDCKLGEELRDNAKLRTVVEKIGEIADRHVDADHYTAQDACNDLIAIRRLTRPLTLNAELGGAA